MGRFVRQVIIWALPIIIKEGFSYLRERKKNNNPNTNSN